MNQPLFPPNIEERFAAHKARILRPPVDDWLKRCTPQNSRKLGNYFPTLEKIFDRGEIAYNNEDWTRAWQDCFKCAEFIFKLKQEHNGWNQKLYAKETNRMLRKLAPKCIQYAEQCQIEIKREIGMQIEAKAAQMQYQKDKQQRAAEEAERSAAMLRQEAKRAKEQGEEARAKLAIAQAEAQAIEAAKSAAEYNAVVVASVVEDGSVGGSVGGSEDTNNHYTNNHYNNNNNNNNNGGASVVEAAIVDEGVPLAPSPLVTLRAGQSITYCKKGIELDATIVTIHHDQDQPYFTISLPGGVEKQTTRQYLQPKMNTTINNNDNNNNNNNDHAELPPAYTSTNPIHSTPPETPLINVNPGIDFSELGGTNTSNNQSHQNQNQNQNTRRQPSPPSSYASFSIQPPPPSYQPRYVPITTPKPTTTTTTTTTTTQPRGPLYGQVRGPSSSSQPKRKPNQSIGGWTINSKCDIKDHFISKYTKRMVTEWRRGQILAINGTKVLVTFYNWGHEHDIWINMSKDSHRLQPYGSKTTEVERQWQGRTLTFREQLQNKGLRIVTMRGDGNCLFRAVAHQIWGDPELHAMVRTMVCDFMLANRGDFAEVLGALVPGPNGFERYVSNMRRPCFQGSGEWGGDPEIRVMEEIFDRPFELWDVERGADGPANIHLEGSLPEDHRVASIRVSYHGKNHYNSVQPTSGQFPLGELNSMNIRNFRKQGEEKRSFDTGYK